ncbi:hypothetical protein BO70DRAFT_31401 [Aspergillus heteromorphus CBS 117.55]|uniref:Uncharacterized protein n=1 Tax=Aspergillus heteromorphus CBS 117.55 TaxID=1448321 RepID=A0A317WAG9_9EURO|nr:uncharacterized protein BO70DRAFT_31401 [Aspergillus heteromorphus CBS 117.55]PWY82885.1 hypothetical protein BO70DRAFT_31401 [Aspergillus heteromorphus CBS 117.55]
MHSICRLRPSSSSPANPLDLECPVLPGHPRFARSIRKDTGEERPDQPRLGPLAVSSQPLVSDGLRRAHGSLRTCARGTNLISGNAILGEIHSSDLSAVPIGQQPRPSVLLPDGCGTHRGSSGGRVSCPAGRPGRTRAAAYTLQRQNEHVECLRRQPQAPGTLSPIRLRHVGSDLAPIFPPSSRVTDAEPSLELVQPLPVRVLTERASPKCGVSNQSVLCAARARHGSGVMGLRVYAGRLRIRP